MMYVQTVSIQALNGIMTIKTHIVDKYQATQYSDILH